MKELFKFFVHERGKAFIRGFFVGGYSGFVFLFDVALDWNHIAWLWAIKFIGIGILAFTSGLMTLLANDVYKHKIKDKIFKPKNDERPEDDEKAA